MFLNYLHYVPRSRKKATGIVVCVLCVCVCVCMCVCGGGREGEGYIDDANKEKKHESQMQSLLMKN